MQRPVFSTDLTRSLGAMLAGYSAILLLLQYRIVPGDCRDDGSMWAAMAIATLPLPIVLAVALVLLSVGRRLIRGRAWRLLGVLAWLWLALHLAALAVLLGGHGVFMASMARGLSMEALQQCLPRIASDYLNATHGFLFWSCFLAIVAAGAVQLLPARLPGAKQLEASGHSGK